jgi:HlyD family secretion protein
MSKKSKRWLGFFVIVVIAIGVAGFMRTKRTETSMVYTSFVERVPELRALVNASGEIQPKESVDIQAEIPGVIIELPVKEGDVVKKGQILLKIDPIATAAEVAAVRAAAQTAEAEAKGQVVQIAMAEANLARDEALLQSAQLEKVQADANCKRADDAYSRRQKLFERKLLSEEDLDIAKTTLDVATAARDAAASRITQYEAALRANRIAMDQLEALRDAGEKRVDAAKANLEKAEDTLKKTTLYSPLDGMITKLNVEAGERAVPGILSNPQATLMTIADMSVMEAQIKVDETDVVQITLGDEAEIEVDALPDKKLKGTVSEIGNSPLLQSNSGSNQAGEVKDFEVKLRVIDPTSELRPGLSCSAEIVTDVRTEVLVVPIQSLTARELAVDENGKAIVPSVEDIDRQLLEEKTGTLQAAPARQERKPIPGVFLRGADGRATFRVVKTGIIGQTDYEIVEGLEAGEEVVSGPYKALRTLEIGDHVAVDNSRKFRAIAERDKTK